MPPDMYRWRSDYASDCKPDQTGLIPVRYSKYVFMGEWQTRLPQKQFLERECWFKSSQTHQICPVYANQVEQPHCRGGFGSSILLTEQMGWWWNGIHVGFRNLCPYGLEGSSPSRPTICACSRMVEASGLSPLICRFKSCQAHHFLDKNPKKVIIRIWKTKSKENQDQSLLIRTKKCLQLGKIMLDTLLRVAYSNMSLYLTVVLYVKQKQSGRINQCH